MKILVVRFSSIGDIVLTTPVVRCLKSQPDTELHYLTFRRFSSVLEHNPYIDRLITIDKSINEVLSLLRQNNYDLIVDLHRNIRTLSLKTKLRRPSVTFRKLNFRKYLLVNFRINLMPDIHIVNRYFESVKKLGVVYDDAGLDYYTGENDRDAFQGLPDEYVKGYIAVVIGGRYITKIYPPNLMATVIDILDKPVVLMGGEEDSARAEEIAGAVIKGKVFNACGRFSLNESAVLISAAMLVITNDTGLMHIAAAYRKSVISIWGNTVPALGMYPFLPTEVAHRSAIIEMENVRCRPCSKLGYSRCPKRHFNCMMKIRPEVVAEVAEELLAAED